MGQIVSDEKDDQVEYGSGRTCKFGLFTLCTDVRGPYLRNVTIDDGRGGPEERAEAGDQHQS
jgi:hypothetical protein